MKRIILIILSITILSFSLIYAQETLTILNLNDTHSNLSSLGPRDPGSLEGTQGGIARAAAYINLVRQLQPNTMVLHAGDSFIGDMFFNTSVGINEFTLLKLLGIDALTLGNHEFDLGTSTLAYAYGEGLAPVPILSANFVLVDTTLQEFGDTVLPYTIKTYGNFKVGILGLTTPETNILSSIQPAAYMDSDFVEIAGAAVSELQSQNCNLIILLSHLGVQYDQLVAQNIPGINVIIGGHDHLKFEQPIEVTNPGGTTTYIVQAGSNYRDIGKIDFELNQGTAAMTNYQLVPLDITVPEDPDFLQAVNDMISAIEITYGPIYSQQIATAEDYFEEVADSLTSNGNHDTPAGNLITDAYRLTMGTDIAMQAGGSIAQPIYAGSLTAIDLFRAVGYGFNEHNGLGFPLVTFNLTGEEIRTGLEIVLTMTESNDEFFPQVSGMSYKYNPTWPAGGRLYEVLIDNAPIDPEATYSVTANQLLAIIMQNNFGFVLQNYKEYPDSTEFQVLTGYVMQLGTISPVTEGRIFSNNTVSVEGDQNSISPQQFQLFQNYPNPFNPDTEIRYQLPESGNVTLKIYDVLGREIGILVNEFKSAGSHTVNWNAVNESSGIYIYTLESNGTRISKKMILLR